MRQFSLPYLLHASRRLFSRPEKHRPSWRPENWPPSSGTPIGPAATFSPDPALIESYTHINHEDVSNITKPRDNLILYKDIPYSQYLGEWQFHPNRIGAYLAATKISPELIRIATKVLEHCVELPNGGLALYYPATIRAARLQVNEPIYSAMSQAQLLAGYTKLALDDPKSGGAAVDWRDVAARLATAMMFPFEQGGVCVDGNVLLETPNFRACPEFILNGWLDALLHLDDYARLFPTREVGDFYRRNLDALCELLPVFDDENARLSLYSDLCPYEFRVHFNEAMKTMVPRVTVEYLPVDSRRAAYCIEDLWLASDTPRNCIYENKIVKCRSSHMDLALSASSSYEIRIHVAADCRNISFDPGSFDARSTVPNPTLKTRSVLPETNYDGTLTTFRINPVQQRLLAGCPTNFLKKGRNFYHMYHVVALYELALTSSMPAQRKVLTDMAARWHAYTLGAAQDRGRGTFFEPDIFTKKIARFRADGHRHSFDELRRNAVRSA